MSKRTPWLLVALAPGLAFGLLVAVRFVYEWLTVGIVADPKVIETYHFGSAAMVGNGGWHYRSAELYARAALCEGLTAMVGAALFVVGGMRRSPRLVASGYGVLVVWTVANYVLFTP